LIFSSFWEFPKGLVERGEDEKSAALREVQEETGLKVELSEDFREEITYFYRKMGFLVKKQVVYFIGSAPADTVHVSWEHREAKWMQFESALLALRFENARTILRKANEFLTERILHEDPRD
jgi:bis(5'-nucleosidyl)-tetraphosphatase